MGHKFQYIGEICKFKKTGKVADQPQSGSRRRASLKAHQLRHLLQLFGVQFVKYTNVYFPCVLKLMAQLVYSILQTI